MLLTDIASAKKTRPAVPCDGHAANCWSRSERVDSNISPPADTLSYLFINSSYTL
jgi:hypothetical protein